MKKLIYNSNLKKDIENCNSKFNTYEEIIKYLLCLFEVSLLTIIINNLYLIPVILTYVTLSIPIFKNYIVSKIKKINSKKKKSSKNIDKLIHELYDNKINIDKKELINSKSITTKIKKTSKDKDNIIKSVECESTDYYLKDIQNKLKILRREKKTILESDKIINECNLYLMNENELDYNIPEEYKRILK